MVRPLCDLFCVESAGRLCVLFVGYMGQPSAEGGVAFLRTNLAPADRLYPNIQLQLCCSLIGGIFKQTWNIKDEVGSNYTHTHTNTRLTAVCPALPG